MGETTAMNPLEELTALVEPDKGLFSDDLPDDFEVVYDDDDWTQDHKYQYCYMVVQHRPTGRYFQIDNSRCGSYHSDWYYNTPTVTEVSRVETVTTVISWKSIPK